MVMNYWWRPISRRFGLPTRPVSPGRVHVAFVADNTKQVDVFYEAALAAGGRDNGPPGPRPRSVVGKLVSTKIATDTQRTRWRLETIASFALTLRPSR